MNFNEQVGFLLFETTVLQPLPPFKQSIRTLSMSKTLLSTVLSQYLTQLPKLKARRSRKVAPSKSLSSLYIIIPSCTVSPKAQSKTHLRQKPVLKHTSIVFGFLMELDYPIVDVRCGVMCDAQILVWQTQSVSFARL